MARPRRTALSNRAVEGLPVGGREAFYWDRDEPAFGVRVYPNGTKVYLVRGRGPGGPKRLAVGRHGTVSADEARRRAAAMLDRIRAGGDRGDGSRRRPDSRRARRALSARTRRGALQAADDKGLPPHHPQAHPAPARQAAGLGARARACGGAALPPAADSGGGERRGGGAVAHVQPGRGVGPGAGREQPLPLREAVPHAPARAVPDRGGVPPPRRDAGRARGRGEAPGPRGGGAQAADADRVPVRRDRQGSAGRTSTSGGTRSGSAIRRRVRARCRCRRGRRGCSPGCRASPATRG